ncbi:MAG: MerR family transcriptional regulator [Bifidobacteriaceae bacterium]|jgi:DNA-binding transcriptional MerR regulator|nr:MerR family transcriptional regulator [Bifidobacteriaceae bacterium]
MSIGDVLADLGGEFPALSPSKLRYLEEQGLVTPARTRGGYRKYCPADVERLRFVLAAQRDQYLPLRVIRDKLDALDRAPASAQAMGVTPGPRPPAGPIRMNAEELAALTGASEPLVAEVCQAAGLDLDVDTVSGGALTAAVEAAMALADLGLEVRHLRPVFVAVARQADLVEAATSARRGSGGAQRERAAALAREIAESMTQLSQAVLHVTLTRRGL